MLSADIESFHRPISPSDKTIFFYGHENGLYDAYKYNLALARALTSNQNNFYSQGIFHLNVSVECFLKYAYCIARKQILNIDSPAKSTGLIQEVFCKENFPFQNEKLTSDVFEHDFRSLVGYFDVFTQAKEHEEFYSLVRHLPSDDKWANELSSCLDQSRYKIKYFKYEADFVAALDKKSLFGGIS